MVLTGPLVYLAMLPDIIILVVGFLYTGFYNRRAQVSQACCTANSWPTSSRHLGTTPISSIDRICYSTSELLSFRKKSPKQRLAPDLWQKLNEIGIRKSFRGKRGGSKKKQEKATPLQGVHPVLVCVTGLPPDSPTGGSQPARLFPAPTDPSVARIPTLLCSNTRSLVPKMIELQIIFGRVDYTAALVLAGLESLSDRRVGACKRFMATARQISPLKGTVSRYCACTKL